MKLEKFKAKNNKRIGIIVFTIVCILLVSGVILYRTFAIFEVRTNQNVIKGTVQDPGNIYFAFYIDNEIQRDMPQRDSGYILDEEASYCGVTGENDSNIKVSLTEDWKIVVSGVTTSRTKCILKFVKGAYILGKPIKAETNNDGLYETPHGDEVTDTTNDNGFQQTEYRYTGQNPNNYITFNDETWRMIGLMNVMTSETEVKQRVKIIRDEILGYYSWDYKDINNEYQRIYNNDWTDSTLMRMLNGIYYNQRIGNCYSGNYTPIQCDFSKNNDQKGLDETSRSMIEKNIIWNIGDSEISGDTVYKYYNSERVNSKIWSSSNTKDIDGTIKNEIFNSIALMYPSDYGYAVGRNGRKSCLSNSMWSYNDEVCITNNWLYDNQNYEWLLAPLTEATFALYRVPDGKLNANSLVTGGYAIRPTIYLKTNVKIIDGFGTEENPYKLALIS